MRHSACAVLLAVLTSVGLVASQGGAAKSGASQNAPAAKADAPTTQVTGCVLTMKEYAAATTLAPSAARETEFVVLDSPVAYALAGGHAVDWSTHLHRRVSIAGRVMPVSSDQTAVPPADLPVATSGAAGATPSGSPAHEAGDAADGKGSGRAQRPTGERGDAQTPRRLPTLTAASVKPTGETCDERGVLVREVASAAPAASAVADGRVPERLDGAAAPAMVATGCLVARSDTASLTLERATVKTRGSADQSSAVPGSRPASQGTGTVRPAPSGTTEADQTFLIVSPSADLKAKAGSYVEITGAVDEPAGRGGDAHESSPASRLTPQSVRVVRDRCP